CWLHATRHRHQLSPPQNPNASLSFTERLSNLGNKRVLAYVLTRFFGDSSGYFFLFWLPEYLVTSKNFTFTMLGAFGWIPFFWNDIGALFGGYASSWLVQRARQPLFSGLLRLTSAAVLVALGAVFQTPSPTPC